MSNNFTKQDFYFMEQCLLLAKKGIGHVEPNPRVACLVVHETEIIASGYHSKFGVPHAEVEALRNITDPSILQACTLYVNLEPCSHHGKTPPCVDLILQNPPKRVVIAQSDPFDLVQGKGIEKLLAHGVQVDVGICEKDSHQLNAPFFTFHQEKRTYLRLKWAQTADGFMDKLRHANEKGAFAITGKTAQHWTHQQRTSAQAILVGKNTVLVDNPKLDARFFDENKKIVRYVIDKNLEIPSHYQIYSDDLPTVIFNAHHVEKGLKSKVKLDFSNAKIVLDQISAYAYAEGVQSLWVEGGAFLLGECLAHDYWDEIHVLHAPQKIGQGLPAPAVPTSAQLYEKSPLGEDTLYTYVRENAL